MTPALVLAGRRNAGRLRSLGDAESEAMVPLLGRPMLAYVLDALGAAQAVGRVVVLAAAADAAGLATACGAQVVPAGGSLVESLRAGLGAVRAGGEPVLVVAGDAPLLTGAAVDEFVAQARATGAEVAWAVVPREAYERELPGSRRTFVRTRDGAFTGGCLFLVRPTAVEPALGLLEAFYAARKQPLRLARLLGADVLVRLVLGRLRLADVERRVGRLAGFEGRAVITARAEVGFDVDTPEDAAYAERVLRRRRGGGGGCGAASASR